MGYLDAGLLGQLERWYSAQCNGDWEHAYGITVETLDNPGWYFKVEITDTYLADRVFEGVSENAGDEKNAFICMVEDGSFVGICAPNRLHEIISIFLRWADNSEQPSRTGG